MSRASALSSTTITWTPRSDARPPVGAVSSALSGCASSLAARGLRPRAAAAASTSGSEAGSSGDGRRTRSRAAVTVFGFIGFGYYH